MRGISGINGSWRGVARGGLLALGALLLVSLAPTALRPSAVADAAPLPQNARVRVGSLRALNEAPTVLAMSRGYFAQEGLDIELVPFSVTADALPPLGTGQIDIVTGGLNPAVFNAVTRGVGVKIVASGGSTGPDNDWFGLVVRRAHLDSGRYRGPADLKGMRIAIPGQYAIVHYVLKVILERNGLTLADVDATPLAMADHASAVNNGAVDALMTIEPFITQAISAGGAVRVLGAQEFTPYLAGGVTLASPQFASGQSDTSVRFMKAWLRGVADYNAAFGPEHRGTEDAMAILRAENIPVNPDTQVPGFAANGRFDVDQMAALLNWYVAEGVVQAGIDLRQVVDFQVVDQAARQLGIAP